MNKINFDYLKYDKYSQQWRLCLIDGSNLFEVVVTHKTALQIIKKFGLSRFEASNTSDLYRSHQLFQL